MNLRKCMLAAICLILPLSLTAGEPGKLRTIDVKGTKIEIKKGTVKMPREIASADDLKDAIPDSDAIAKQVDFGKDKLLLFGWGGSGGDKLVPKMSDDGKTVTFAYTPGLTRDFRRHVHLFAIPKTAEFKVENTRGGK